MSQQVDWDGEEEQLFFRVPVKFLWKFGCFDIFCFVGRLICFLETLAQQTPNSVWLSSLHVGSEMLYSDAFSDSAKFSRSFGPTKTNQVAEIYKIFPFYGGRCDCYLIHNQKPKVYIFFKPLTKRTETWALKDLANSRAPLHRECSGSREWSTWVQLSMWEISIQVPWEH